MKKALSFIFVYVLMVSVCIGQQNFEKKTYIEINERASFYVVDESYKIVSTDIYYCNSGFLIDAEYDIFIKEGIEYVIITYPPFVSSSKKQQADFNGDEDNNEKTDKEPIISDILKSGSRKSIKGVSGKVLMIEKSKFDKLAKTTLYDTRWTLGRLRNSKKWYNGLRCFVPYVRNYKITTGLLTIPFKLRPSQDTLNFKMTTDVTMGPYFGITKRISPRNNYYITFPATLGLTFINIKTNANVVKNNDIDVIPGFSWSSGAILQFDKFSIGYVFGQDFGSGIGKNWEYQGKTWHSFAIGYSFLKEDK